MHLWKNIGLIVRRRCVAELKLTKTELRDQQVRLGQLQKYLPTLQLKKALLQIEVLHAHNEIEQLNGQLRFSQEKVEHYEALFSTREVRDLLQAVKVVETRKKYDNIAGIEIPLLERVIFEDSEYSLFDTPVWLDAAVEGVKELITLQEKRNVAEEKKRLLEKELREVSIRVNLFEKIMIPRAIRNIKKIRIFLGDQQLAAVAQAKVSKQKILQKKAEEE